MHPVLVLDAEERLAAVDAGFVNVQVVVDRVRDGEVAVGAVLRAVVRGVVVLVVSTGWRGVETNERSEDQSHNA